MGIAQDEPGGGAALVSVKAVPGARRGGVAGRLGDRLKVRVAEPPGGGRANRAVCELLAAELGVRGARVTVVRGAASPEKTVRVEGVAASAIEARWP
jgi:uncharacterized protein YggU (UPF0235/DUF167 family)